MKSLFIDTSTTELTLFYKDDKGQKLFTNTTNSQSQILIPEIKNIITPYTINQLNLIIIINGPGSFTGIRLGLSMAKAFKLATPIPIITINNFQYLAISSNHPINNTTIIIKDTDTQSYMATLNTKLEFITPPQLIQNKDIQNMDAITNTNTKKSPELLIKYIMENIKNQDSTSLEALYIKPHYAKLNQPT